MASRPQSGGSSPPPKPWERAGTSSAPAPFNPPSTGSTSNIVEASCTSKPGGIVSPTETNASVNRNALARPIPTRPWRQNYETSYAGYGSSRFGSRLYGSHGGGLFGNSVTGGGGYGGPFGNSGMYGVGTNNGGLGGPVGGFGMGVGAPYGNQLPNNPFGGPPPPPGFWLSFLRVMEGAVTFFGRIAILTEQSTQAFHIFMSALLQLFDRSGILYGELARFVLRLLGIRTKPRKVHPPGSSGHGPSIEHGSQKNYIDGPTATAASGSWDTVWGK